MQGNRLMARTGQSPCEVLMPLQTAVLLRIHHAFGLRSHADDLAAQADAPGLS
jgi:hypothetical protein